MAGLLIAMLGDFVRRRKAVPVVCRMIIRLQVRNFKSWRDIDLALGPLNVLVGPNMSGKSSPSFQQFADRVRAC